MGWKTIAVCDGCGAQGEAIHASGGLPDHWVQINTCSVEPAVVFSAVVCSACFQTKTLAELGRKRPA